MSSKNLLVILMVFLGLNALQSQVLAPSFSCIANDTLIWDNTVNTCGPYEATEIYLSNNPNGPFTLLTELNDPAATEFFDPNPTGELRFYFLRYRYDCPGVAVLTSDTLDNRIPLSPTSTWVSVIDSTVQVNWTTSNSPEVSGYLIYREEPQGLIVVGQVDENTTTFVDNSFLLQPDGITYRVTAIDDCGNNSLFGPEVTTASFLADGGQGCTASVTLNTDATLTASNPLPLTGWTLFVSVNGGPYQATGNFGPQTSTFTYDLANDGETLCYYAEGAVQGQAGRPVRTPIQCSTINITQPVRNFDLWGGNVSNTGDLQIFFPWDELAATSSLVATVIANSGVATDVSIPFGTLTGPVAQVVIPASDLPAGTYSLFLRAEDVCGNVVITNTLFPVFLSGQVSGTSVNALNWTAFDNEILTGVSYRLIRTGLDGSETTVYTGSDLSYMDQVSPDDANLAFACYQVIAEVQFSDGSLREYTSAQVCLEQQPMVYLPNVFSPRAIQILNREFCPGFSRFPTGTYQLDIFDRWGGHVFSSEDPAACWDGNWRGQLAETGVYIYVLRMEIGSRVIEQKGDVTFLR